MNHRAESNVEWQASWEGSEIGGENPLPPPVGNHQDPGFLLDRIIDQASRLDGIVQDDIQQLSQLKNRLEEGRFHLAVVGQFKRGKSSILNALLGEEILPTSVVPLTAIPTFIAAGNQPSVRISFQDQRPPEECAVKSAQDISAVLSRFVTENENPQNRKGVEKAEVFYPAPLLREGVVLIDTPGIGSTFKHNTETTIQFLPQCDAAMFLVSADPPITEVELQFLKLVHTKIPHLFFLFNKVDYLNESEKQHALAFLRKVLAGQIGLPESTPVFPVSARRGFQARQSRDAGLWKDSGLETIESHLLQFLVREKHNVLRGSVLRKASEILAGILMRIQLTLRALRMPLEDLEKRLSVFKTELDKARHQRIITSDLLAGEQKRLLQVLESQARALRDKAVEHFTAICRPAVQEAGATIGEATLHDLLEDAIPVFFERELGVVSSEFSRRVDACLQPYQTRLEEIIESVKKTAANIFEIPYTPTSSSEWFKMERQPYWVTHKWDSTFSLIPIGWVERFLPARWVRSRVTKRISDQIHQLALNNVENLRWATLQNLNKTFRFFNTTLSERFENTIRVTEGAIQAALDQRRQQAGEIAQSVERLEEIRIELESLHTQIIHSIPLESR
ncbi:MAG TPA: dynamin family protein [bacterium]|nr:dynamin family protein [bacterium]